MQKIAIIGWGSLIWNRGSDSNLLKIIDDFKPGGPVFKIEFCRISSRDKANERVTLVIDEAHGVDVATYWRFRSLKVLSKLEKILKFVKVLFH